MQDVDPSLTSLDKLVLTEYPYPIAANYRKILEASDWRSKVELALALFEYGLRTIAIGVISQYLTRDAEQVSDPVLNNLLLRKLPQATLGSWKEILFTALKAYAGKRGLFFMKELYDLYWDTSCSPHRQRPGVQRPFDQLIQIRNDLAHRPKPSSEAGWQTVAGEVLTNLREVLGQFTFIQNYDLVRVMQRDGDAYVYVLFSGEHPVISSTPFHSKEDLRPGWFYLSKQSKDFLPLHPLLIFWEEPGATLTVPSLSDAAIYDTFTNKSVNYIATVLGKLVETPSLMSEIKILYYNIEKVKQHRHEAQRLSWSLLQDLAQKIADQRFGDVRTKYYRELYLQRQEVRAAFCDFLDSDKTAFLLLGKSGVGKSNFFISLADEFQSQDKVCFLLYNGAKLETDKPLAEVIGRDFETHLRLVEEVGEVGFRDFLAEIARIPGIEKHQVVLFIDAINENADAKNLLRNIDALITAASPYHWFKIVFSSRPEAWKVIKRRVNLAEHRYYCLTGQERLGTELQPFSHSSQPVRRLDIEQLPLGVEMQVFTHEELSLVYDKYRQIYGLQTAYQDIPRELRRLLNDPLTLKLVAEIYHGRPLPNTIRPSEIYPAFVDKLIREGRLYLADVVFLEQDLMPLMMKEPYANTISAEQVNTTYTSSGKKLFELIHSDEVLSNGWRVNQSYTNLADAEILVTRGSPTNYEIGFKYERFYDFYAGKKFYQLSQSQKAPALFFTTLIGQTLRQPFLWGAVRNAMIQDAKDNGIATILRLCYTDQQRVKEMLVNTIVELGRDDLDQTKNILEQLIPTQPQSSILHQVWRLAHRAIATPDKQARNAKKIAVEVASELSVPHVLQNAAMQQDPEVRTSAVRYSYHLWCREPNAGFEVLEFLVERTMRGLIPDLTVFESVLGLSLSIFFDSVQDREVLIRLQKSWRMIISKTLGIQESGGHLTKLLREYTRERILSIGITLVFRLLREMPQYAAVVNYPDFEAFFRLNSEDKAFYRRLTQYIDLQGGYSKEQMESDYLSVLGYRNFLIQGIAQAGMLGHAIQSPNAFLPFLRRFFEAAQADPLPNPYISDVPYILASILDQNPNADEVFSSFLRSAEVCQEYYTRHVRIPGLNRDRLFEGANAMFMGPCVLYQYQRTGSVSSEWSERRIETALTRRDTPFFERLLLGELHYVGIDRQRPRIALDVVGSIISKLPLFDPRQASSDSIMDP